MKARIIYVMCPGFFKTGGSELAHQLVFQLNQININATMVYYLPTKKKYKLEINPAFLKYTETFITEEQIEDAVSNILIVPEVACDKLVNFDKIVKMIWWMSVNNFLKKNSIIESVTNDGILKTVNKLLKKDIKDRKSLIKTAEINLCQSFYAMDFLENMNISGNKIVHLSDYINDSFLKIAESNILCKTKKNTVLYNPQKGYKFTKKIIKKYPCLNWIAIKNLTTEEVKELLIESKIYVDFGTHPGKDRFPREAALAGCCIITGKKGSAAYSKDVPIYDEYKFDDYEINIEKIGKKIIDCLENYEENIMDFREYRDNIRNEKIQFQNDVKYIFLDTEK